MVGCAESDDIGRGGKHAAEGWERVPGQGAPLRKLAAPEHHLWRTPLLHSTHPPRASPARCCNDRVAEVCPCPRGPTVKEHRGATH